MFMLNFIEIFLCLISNLFQNHKLREVYLKLIIIVTLSIYENFIFPISSWTYWRNIMALYFASYYLTFYCTAAIDGNYSVSKIGSMVAKIGKLFDCLIKLYKSATFYI